ncbi:Eco57I restriction-modification methylase domain-containing protein [Rhodococcoides fascians]|uniref:Eco57I restriction-modification methylase domain-containing protein n=1 Tax=Rhodococcoides fascians TaxID=1828 RepID=UPI00277DBF29|nr:hypothetical protein [Rhodococcus fascians]MDQ0284120.1 hypothetical protein [Rhodococcus fascians]
MNTFYKPRRGRRPSSTDWLQILDVDGPFLAAPVVTDTWPDGLPALDQKQMDELRAASILYDANPGARDAFVAHVLSSLLDWRTNFVVGPEAANYAVQVPEHRQIVDISFVLRAQDADGTSNSTPLLLGVVLPPRTPTTGRAPAGTGTWTAGPADRLAHAMRVRKVALGLVTNGETWTLVTLSTKDGKDETSAVSHASWTRHAWLEEQQTLRAFVALLTRTRFYGVPDDETLPGLLTKSLDRQEEVTERLAEQSQAVVEMIVASIGRLDAHHLAEHGTRLLPAEVGPAEVYQAAVTILMRLVFLLYAEERGLLPLDDDTYANAYAVNTLASTLRDRAADRGEDALERTATGWYRLLALFRGVHRGARHEQMVLPAYGGSLFDPDRFPWLEGRSTAAAPLGEGDVPAIDDRTLLKALESLQTLKFAKERRQVSYRTLDVEQIGYVYEGLLDQDALLAADWVVSISVSDKDLRKNGPELLLTDLEQRHALGDDELATWLVGQIKNMGGKRSKVSILRALAPLSESDRPSYERLVREACGNNDAVTARLMPFAKLLRLDPRDLPVVYPPGSLYLTDSTARSNTGAVYTPKFLAEQVVETTLEAIVYSPGPLDTEDKSAWVLKTPEQILDLKVCDIAAGSGAFLVAATRYLADRLLESRRQYVGTAETHMGSDAETPGETDQGDAPAPSLGELARAEQDELDARRDVITHCIYGVDINHMALEMAKLSLWLTSLDPRRPFSFLDDHLAVGDSLLGITSAQQLIDLHFEPKRGHALHRDTLDLFTSSVERDLKVAAELRAQIIQTGDRDSRDADTKQRLLRRAHEVTAHLAMVADGLTAASLAGGQDSDYLALTAMVGSASEVGDFESRPLREWVDTGLLRDVGDGRHRPAHYPLIFPEVFNGCRPGFDAVVGNPPFLGGSKIALAHGQRYREHLIASVSLGVRAPRADLVAWMVLRAVSLINDRGVCGLIGTNSLGQGDTREVGLDVVERAGLTLYAATKSEDWPTGGANLEYCIVWISSITPSSESVRRLDGKSVAAITPSLDAVTRAAGAPASLLENADGAFIGSKPLGVGFKLDASVAAAFLRADPKNAAVLFPHLNGEDLNSNHDFVGSRWIVNFFDWPREVAEKYAGPWEHIVQHVKPQRDALPKSKAKLQKTFWVYEARAKKLYDLIAAMDRVVVMAETSSTLQPVIVPTGQVFDQKLIVFTTDSAAQLAILSSAAHYWWAIRRGATRRADLSYSPSDIFATFPRPTPTRDLEGAGSKLMHVRQAVMGERKIGLTKAYHLVHDSDMKGVDVLALRDTHVEVDTAVIEAYGWSDLVRALKHGHYETRQGVRWTVHPDVQSELLDRLLELNHERHANENASGLVGNRGVKRSAKAERPKINVFTLFGGDE